MRATLSSRGGRLGTIGIAATVAILHLLLFVGCGGEISGGDDLPGLVGVSGGKQDNPERQSQVVNGVSANGYFSSVVWIDSGCSGVLIGRRTVLTAAHCIKSTTYGVWIGGHYYPAAYLVTHSYWKNAYPFYYDIGLVLLHHSSHISPSPIASSPPAVDAKVYVVGYGETSLNRQDYAKRWSNNWVGWVKSTTVTLKYPPVYGTGNICYGDSGGPTFDAYGRVIGIHNFWDGYFYDNPCWYGYGRDTRVDAFRGWIAKYKSWWEG